MMRPDPPPVPFAPPRGGVLLLLPGIVCDRAVWEPVLPRLSHCVECRVPEGGPESNIAAMAERVLASAPASFSLAAHSMGGRVALEVVRRAPQRVERLALLDTGWRARPADGVGEEERASRLALLALAREQGMRAMGRVWVERMVHPARLDDDTLMTPILDMIERHAPDRFAAQIEALLARPDGGDVLRGLRCPTLVLCGRQDAWSPLARHEEMAAMIPGAVLEVIEDCGHMAPMERPAEVADALVRWLSAPFARHVPERRWAS